MKRSLLVVSMLSLATPHLGAQQEPGACGADPCGPRTLAFAPLQQGAAVFLGGPDAIGVVAVEPFETGKPVTGAPYSAIAVTEVTQALADGNRIEHRTSVAIHRDSQGRVRRELPSLPLGGLIAQPGEPMVTISDPVSGTHVVLDGGRRAIGTRRAGGDVLFERAVPAPPPPPPPPAPAPRADVRTEKLGEQQIEGLRAEGTRTTMTIAAGTIGNQLPIEVVSERWYSPELQVVVMTRRNDPRFGETVYRLTEIVRAEPPAELFQAPAAN